MCRPQIMTNFLTSVLVISILLFNYKSQASLGRRIPTGSSGMNTNVAIYPGKTNIHNLLKHSKDTEIHFRHKVVWSRG